MLRLGDGLSADAAGEDDAAAVRVRLLHGETGVGQSLPRRRHSELGKAAHALGLLTAQQGLRIEALYLCRQLYLLGGGIVMGDGADAAHAVFTDCQLSPAVSPMGVTAPRPVMTTLRRSMSRSSLHTHAAVNGQDLPGDVACVLVG